MNCEISKNINLILDYEITMIPNLFPFDIWSLSKLFFFMQILTTVLLIILAIMVANVSTKLLTSPANVLKDGLAKLVLKVSTNLISKLIKFFWFSTKLSNFLQNIKCTEKYNFFRHQRLRAKPMQECRRVCWWSCFLHLCMQTWLWRTRL